ncbi:prepilin-type N-terminal cleavage/methylation domain-containing protein [Ligilactobacillus faecis]|uniref:prepilin-type N-terminal cleavage/methylation domain-containing protein n=1 Tax=Ligilactobacillus faecis TaxID=762833 RepID=UPI0024687582|nr:prepilin-type N-terminal cleavage/methylation domain-containing protein [Ligilactobacillus faecis]WGN89647.1 prepilin-type N-terminal cleavage/methylation domain-containing protein [Ligilactobacillus faecis]
MEKKKVEAFTLLEMSVVLFIISLLILIIIPNITKQRTNAENVNTQALQAELNTQAQLYADEKDVALNSIAPEQLEKEGYLTARQVKEVEKHHLKIGKQE